MVEQGVVWGRWKNYLCFGFFLYLPDKYFCFPWFYMLIFSLKVVRHCNVAGEGVV